MRYSKKNFVCRKGLTLLEMVIAMAIISVVFASVLPLFRNVQASWDARRGGSEAVQNGRAAMEYLKRHLSVATRVTSVSSLSNMAGYIEFVDNTGTTLRCDLSANNYIQFGPVGSQSELAGPVTSLQFTCYSLDDLDSPTTDVDLIRLVKIEADFVNSASGAEDKSFSTSVYLQTSGDVSVTATYTPYEFDAVKGKELVLAQIDTEHYFCAYTGNNDDGWATILTVDTATWEISRGSLFEFDDKKGKSPDLRQIDPTHYLCAYQGDNDDGWAAVLTVDTGTWEIGVESSFEFDKKNGKTPSLARIDSTHYLCAYESDKDDGWAAVLTVDTGTWEIELESSFEFDDKKGKTPSLAKIDSTHYLCAYSGDKDDGWVVVLTVDASDWSISKETPYEYDPVEGKTPELKRLDSTHYLCSYSGEDGDGWSTVFTVDTDSWNISDGTFDEFNPEAGKAPQLAPISSNKFLCVYERCNGKDTHDGWYNTFTVNTGAWSVSSNSAVEFAADTARDLDVINIMDDYCLCVYSGDGDDAWAVVINPSGNSEMRP